MKIKEKKYFVVNKRQQKKSSNKRIKRPKPQKNPSAPYFLWLFNGNQANVFYTVGLICGEERGGGISGEHPKGLLTLSIVK